MKLAVWLLLAGTAQEDRQLRGVFRSIDASSVVVGEGDGGHRPVAFALAEGVAVVVDGRSAVPGDLADGMSVRLVLDGARKVAEIRAEGRAVVGELRSFDPAKRLVVLAGRPDVAYYLEPETRIASNPPPGARVELRMSADGLRVLSLAQVRGEAWGVELLDLQPGARTLMFAHGEGRKVLDLPLAPDARILIDGRAAALEDLSPMLPLRARVTLAEDGASILEVSARRP